jgi:hypothetical protein
VWWQVGAAVKAVVACVFIAIALALLVPLLRTFDPSGTP